MSEMVKRWLQRMRCDGEVSGAPDGRQRGQSLVIVVLAFTGILALVGLGIDLGLVYVERVRVGRAADAAALAAVAELPLEEAAHRRALVYLQDNGYNYQAANTQVITNAYKSGVYTTTGDLGLWTTIWVDTAYSRDPSTQLVNTANRIRIRVRQQVPMTFLQFIGFRHFPVEAIAEAENVSYIDTVIVYDRSGSMEFNTVCYGCWEMPRVPVSGTPDDPGECRSSDTDCCLASEHPDGCIWPLPWAKDTGQASPPDVPDHCLTDNPYHTDGSEYYIVIEAEEYSYTFPGYDSVDYHQTYWAIQRNDERWYGGYDTVGAKGRDGRGAYIQHRPSYSSSSGPEASPGVNCNATDIASTSCSGMHCCDLTNAPNSVAPWVEYDFDVPAGADGTYYFWMRGQGGDANSRDHVFWGVDGDSPDEADPDFPNGPTYSYDGARDNWGWRKLGSRVLNAGSHTLILWGGGSGFSADRIIITTDDTTESGLKHKDDSQANDGRTREACNGCDPRFAGRRDGEKVCSESDPSDCQWRPDCPMEDQRLDPLYRGERPIQDALNAAEHFITLLDPHFNQVGYVSYNSSASIRNELECLRQRGVDNLQGGSSSCDPDDNTPDCCNPDASDPGGEPPCDPDCGCTWHVITNTVIYELQHTFANGGTDIAEGMMDGLEVLSTEGPCDKDEPDPEHCGRHGAAHVMIVMTDGRANQVPNSSCHSGDNAYLWPPDPAVKDDPAKTGSENDAADCVVFYALEARDSGVVVYTIALGNAADHELMNYVAQLTGGEYFPVMQPEQLVDAFEEVYKRVFLRLTR